MAARWAAGCCGPIARQEFFNVRTYVRCEGHPAIFFISEWLNNRLSVMSGARPLTVCRTDSRRIQYDHRPEEGRLTGRVGYGFAYTAEIARGASFQPCASGSLDEFLLERSIRRLRSMASVPAILIFGINRGCKLPVDARITDDRLLRENFPWFSQAQFGSANYSPGVLNVWLGAPPSYRTYGSYRSYTSHCATRKKVIGRRNLARVLLTMNYSTAPSEISDPVNARILAVCRRTSCRGSSANRCKRSPARPGWASRW